MSNSSCFETTKRCKVPEMQKFTCRFQAVKVWLAGLPLELRPPSLRDGMSIFVCVLDLVDLCVCVFKCVKENNSRKFPDFSLSRYLSIASLSTCTS